MVHEAIVYCTFNEPGVATIAESPTSVDQRVRKNSVEVTVQCDSNIEQKEKFLFSLFETQLEKLVGLIPNDLDVVSIDSEQSDAYRLSRIKAFYSWFRHSCIDKNFSLAVRYSESCSR